MTEAKWLACRNPEQMLEFLHGKVSDRRARLCLCVCCRASWEGAGQEEIERILALGERWADGDQPDAYARSDALGANGPLWERILEERDFNTLELVVKTQFCLDPDPLKFFTIKYRPDWRMLLSMLPALPVLAIVWVCTGWLQKRRHPDAPKWVPLIRDVFGNPFRPTTFAPEWRTDTAVTLAQQMYEARDFSAMPILADALQDAGCDDADVLDHCHGSEPHVRGCWVVDSVLGKA